MNTLLKKMTLFLMLMIAGTFTHALKIGTFGSNIKTGVGPASVLVPYTDVICLDSCSCAGNWG